MANKVTPIDVWRKQTSRGPIDGGGNPPYDGDMELRVKALESTVSDIRERLAKIDARLDSVATSTDLHKEIGAQTWKLVTFVTGFGSILCAAVYFIATHVK